MSGHEVSHMAQGGEINRRAGSNKHSYWLRTVFRGAHIE